MFIEIRTIRIEYTRPSKSGKPHAYYRNRNIAVLKCDCCGVEFQRPVSQMDRRRLNNEYSHVCPNCDGKKFAQSKGVERRKFWNITVDTDKSI